MAATANGQTVAVTATTNDHVDLINRTIQSHRLESGDVAGDDTAVGMNGQAIHVGDQIATRRNDRHLRTSTGDMVRNRETWAVTDISGTGDIVARRNDSSDNVTLPAGYVAEHVQLGYATTEPGNQGDTHDLALALVTSATTSRGLYVAMTRGRHENTALVVTGDQSVEAAIDVLTQVLASDRADTPAIAQRRELAAQIPPIVRAPELQPRCQVPDWWHARRDDLVDAIGTVRRDLVAAEAARHERAGMFAIARFNAGQAAVALRPYRHGRRDLVDRLTQAEATKQRAEETLSGSGLFERRACRVRLADASAKVEELGAAVDALDQRWKSRRDADYRANRRLNEVGESHQLRDRLDQARKLPQRLALLTDHLAAFDCWRDWAQGGQIAVAVATRMVEVLDLPTDGGYNNALAAAVRRVSPHLIAQPEAAPIAHEHDCPVDFTVDL